MNECEPLIVVRVLPPWWGQWFNDMPARAHCTLHHGLPRIEPAAAEGVVRPTLERLVRSRAVRCPEPRS